MQPSRLAHDQPPYSVWDSDSVVRPPMVCLEEVTSALATVATSPARMWKPIAHTGSTHCSLGSNGYQVHGFRERWQELQRPPIIRSHWFVNQGVKADSQPSEGSPTQPDPQSRPQRVPQQLCTQVTLGRPTARLCLAFWTTEVVKVEHYLFLLHR